MIKPPLATPVWGVPVIISPVDIHMGVVAQGLHSWPWGCG